jgi:Xaa-Pro aminopeptidase
MGFSAAERDRRHRAMQQIMAANDLKAILLMGDTNVGGDLYGDFRYLVDNRIIFYRQVAILFPASAPVLFAGSAIQRQAASLNSSIRDCRLSNHLPADIAGTLRERGVSIGKVGVNLDVLPVRWMNHLKKELPAIDWVETHDLVLAARFRRSAEEANLLRRCGPLADGGYEAALGMIRPGVSEYEIAAAIEGYARARGAEQHFTLIGSGRFVPGGGNRLSLPYSPSQRRIESGDSVVMEITPCLEGYWTQLVRTVNVVAPNPEIEKPHRVARDALQKALEHLRPGKTVQELVSAIDASIRSVGYLPSPPYGHVCAVDLVEARVSAENVQVLEPGTAVIIHPTVLTPDGKNSFFWGETYLVTDRGHERINQAKDELLTV